MFYISYIWLYDGFDRKLIHINDLVLINRLFQFKYLIIDFTKFCLREWPKQGFLENKVCGMCT